MESGTLILVCLTLINATGIPNRITHTPATQLGELMQVSGANGSSTHRAGLLNEKQAASATRGSSTCQRNIPCSSKGLVPLLQSPEKPNTHRHSRVSIKSTIGTRKQDRRHWVVRLLGGCLNCKPKKNRSQKIGVAQFEA